MNAVIWKEFTMENSPNDLDPRLLAMIPKLTPVELQGLKDYFKILEAHRPDMTAQLIQVISKHPEFKTFMQNSPSQQGGGGQGTANELQHRAIFDGEWEPYIKSLQAQGMQYAQTDLSFHAWFDIVGALRRIMVPYLLKEYSKSPKRLLSAINGVDLLIDLAMGVIGESYLETRERSIRDQEKKMKLLIERAKSDEKFYKAFRASPAAISIATMPDGRWLEINEALTKMTGYTSEEVIGRTSAELGLVDAAARAKILESIRDKGYVRDVEIQMHTKSNEIVEVLVSVEQIEIDGQACALTIQYDITELKSAERQVRRLNHDLEQRQVALEATNKELEAFSYSVSHDLRAPLRSIDGFSQALLEDFGDQIPVEGQGYLQRIRLAAQKMANLIDDLLNLSRVTRALLKPISIDLSELAGGIVNELKESQPERNVVFSIEPNLTATADLNLTKIVLENLLNNAWKFTSKQPEAKIEFGCKQHADRPQFFVSDNGAGFDMNYADKLFGAFQRLHSENDYPGTGVGLATVQRIIHRHGGEVHAQGSINHGATFYFTLS
jgi:PAS domain S-box-containing protein